MLFASKHALSRVNPNEARADERTVNREELILPNPQRKDDPVAPGIQVACERMKRREILGCNMRPLAQAGFAFYGMRRRRLKTRQASQWGVSGDWFYQTRVPLQAAVKPAGIAVFAHSRRKKTRLPRTRAGTIGTRPIPYSEKDTSRVWPCPPLNSAAFLLPIPPNHQSDFLLQRHWNLGRWFAV